jgi:hypothetical protein
MRGAPLKVGLLGHEKKTLVAEEGHPASRDRVWLRKRSDQRIALITERGARGRVQPCDQLARMTFDAWRDPAAVRLDEIHRQKAGFGVMHAWNREIGVTGELAQHVALEREIGCAALA